MVPELQSFIAKAISVSRPKFSPVGGGSINQTYRIESASSKYFCKVNAVENYPGLFEKERRGLDFLKKADCIRVPEVIWHGEHEGNQVLVLEWIEQGLRTDSFWKKFGEQLAVLHQKKWPDLLRNNMGRAMFGFEEDNYMGALAQINTPSENWIDFFQTCRLQPQVELAKNKQLLTASDLGRFNKLYNKLESIFSIEHPVSLHGDLWSGNYLCDENSNPVLIDPAVYFGQRSMDLGMTTLFGGFNQIFYESYRFQFPLPPNYQQEWEVCNLYPLLIHLNLFGSGYLSSIRSILTRYN